ncbi:MAG: CvpA family protein [Chloroflexi bacterium]|nr:CvpA family protein [Chloroflexota bacterium]
MISLQFIFFFMIIFFATIGYMRGWQREVISLTGIIGALAMLTQFGDILTGLVGSLTGGPNLTDPFSVRRQQFWIQTIFITIVAFFSYQVVARLADQAMGGRFGERLRGGLEKRILGALFGAVNGYLLIGSLWGFLEYQITQNGYVRLPLGEPYPFDASVIVRPIADASAAALADMLPLGVFSPTVWLVLFFVSFFFIIAALI